MTVCRACGQIFDSKSSNQKYCRQYLKGSCPVCGKEVRYRCGDAIPTCSKECLNKYKAKRQSEERKKRTYTHTCVLCRKEYTDSRRTSPENSICPDIHYYQCEVCGKEFQIPNKIKHRTTCSLECQKVKNSNSNKLSSVKGQERKKQTCMERYGVDSFSKTGEFVEKYHKTNLARYGKDSFSRTEEFLEKTKATNQARYGCNWYTQTAEHKESVKRTNEAKYGSNNVSRSRYFLQKQMTDPSKVDNLIKFKEDPEKFINHNYNSEPTLSELSKECGILESSVSYILRTRDMKSLIKLHHSKVEDEIYNFLSENISDTIERNTFKIITPLELDLYIPNKRIGIEIDPTYTHNSTKGIRNTDPKEYGYHLNKTNKCEEQGIFLFHVFGYDWTWKSNIIKSMLLNILGATPNRIYARNTEVGEVSFKDSQEFLNLNHRQGSAVSSIRLGLYHDNELVSLMTFSKMRNSLGTGSEDLSDCMELVRFCNKLNTNVIGGASKLFTYFKRNFKAVKRVRSFSDKARTRGTLYSVLGFNKIHENGPSYRWVNPLDDTSYSRVACQKRYLPKILNDNDLDLSKTEVEIMEQHGYVRVYDCGTVLWEWNRFE